ncbi:MAG TPA: hypothetical protein VFJ60_03560 [Gaiella sp.]|nr:hypothetical protein [Gaiella sp.]
MALVAVGLVAGLVTGDVVAGDKIQGPNGERKVVVCKYVGTPGVDERLQTGDNPITPDAHSLPGFTGTFPWQFADAHGRSIAIRWAANSHDGDISECPPPRGPVEVTPLAPTFQDPTCEVGAAVNLPTVTGVTYAVTGTVAAGHEVTVRATAAEGYVLVGRDTWTHTFGDVPANCAPGPNEVTATAPTFQDPTCDLGAAVHLPTVAGVSYTVSGAVAAGHEVTVRAKAAEGYVLVGTDEWKHSFGSVPDNCGPPPGPATEVTPGVTFQDPTCEAGAAVIPTTTVGLTYTIEGKVAPGEKVTVTASANDGYTIRGGNTWEHTFGQVPSNCATTPPTETTPTPPTPPTAPTAPLTPPTTTTKPTTKPAAKPAPKPAPAPPKQAVAGASAQEPPKLAYTP